MVLTLDGFPRNKEKYRRLIDFSRGIIEICEGLGVDLILDGSLAVFAYTKTQEIDVNDIDLACPEAAFPRITAALEARGTKYRLREWHVLQVLKDDLRVELGSIEYWYQDLPTECETLQIGDRIVKLLGLGSLKALYRRGLDNTAVNMDEGNNRLKNKFYRVKYDALNAIAPESER
jgi:hypothetical protein